MVYFGGHCKTCLKVQKVQPSYIVWLHALSSDQCFGVHTRPFSLSRDGRLDWVSLYLFVNMSAKVCGNFGREAFFLKINQQMLSFIPSVLQRVVGVYGFYL